MIHIKHFVQEIFACGWVRGIVPAAEINSHFSNIRVDVKQDILYSDLPGTHVAVFQRQHDIGIFEKMKAMQGMGIKCLYEVDDDLLNMPREFQKPAEFYQREDVRSTIVKFLKESDGVIVSTEELKNEFMQRAVNDYVVIPNSLEFGMWEPSYRKRMVSQKEGITIGYHASGSHNIDIPLAWDALDRIMKMFPQVKLHFIGWIGFESFPKGMFDGCKDRVKVDPWINVADLPDAISDFDIAIAPLVDNKFNLAKSNIKYIELSSEAIPLIASPMPCYTKTITDGLDGIIVEDNSPGKWFDCIADLVKNREKRIAIGNSARENAMRRWDVKSIAKQWCDYYRNVVKRV